MLSVSGHRLFACGHSPLTDQSAACAGAAAVLALIWRGADCSTFTGAKVISMRVAATVDQAKAPNIVCVFVIIFLPENLVFVPPAQSAWPVPSG